MSDTEPDSELERIREQKRRELAQQAEGGADEPVHVDSVEEFERLVGDERVVLVDFYADWCGPCKMLEPTVEAVAADTDAAVAKVDTDELGALAQQYGVRGLPTLLLFVDGEPTERLVGVQEEAKLKELVASA